MTNRKPRPAWFKLFTKPSICCDGILIWAAPEESQALANWLFRVHPISFPTVSATTKSKSCAFFTVPAGGLRSCDGPRTQRKDPEKGHAPCLLLRKPHEPVHHALRCDHAGTGRVEAGVGALRSRQEIGFAVGFSARQTGVRQFRGFVEESARISICAQPQPRPVPARGFHPQLPWTLLSHQAQLPQSASRPREGSASEPTRDRLVPPCLPACALLLPPPPGHRRKGQEARQQPSRTPIEGVETTAA